MILQDSVDAGGKGFDDNMSGREQPNETNRSKEAATHCPETSF